MYVCACLCDIYFDKYKCYECTLLRINAMLQRVLKILVACVSKIVGPTRKRCMHIRQQSPTIEFHCRLL